MDDDFPELRDYFASFGASAGGIPISYDALERHLVAGGYEFPPHEISTLDSSEGTLAADPSEIDPLTLSRVRSKPRRLVEGLVLIDPVTVELDPFLGEAAPYGGPDVENLRRILDAEFYVSAAAACAMSAVSTVGASRAEMLAAVSSAARERAARTEATRALIVANLEHAEAKLRGLDATEPEDAAVPSGVPGSLGTETFRQLYAGQVDVAEHQLATVDALRKADHAEAAFGRFVDAIGDAVDLLNFSNAKARLEHRRTLKRWRKVRFAAASLVVPSVALVLDQLISLVWAFAGAAVFAAVMIYVDQLRNARQRTKWIQSQIVDLAKQVQAAESAIEIVKAREHQLNKARAQLSLEPLVLVPVNLLDPTVGSGR